MIFNKDKDNKEKKADVVKDVPKPSQQKKSAPKKSKNVNVTVLVDSYVSKDGTFRKGDVIQLPSKKADKLSAKGVIYINKKN